MPEPTDTPRPTTVCADCGLTIGGCTCKFFVAVPPAAPPETTLADIRRAGAEARAMVAPEPGADAAWEALAQALDRMETAWNALGPDVWADSARGVDGPAHLVAQTLWFGQEEARAALDSSRAALARPTPALDVPSLINDLYDAIFAIPIREVDPDTGKVTPADPEEVRDAALGAVILARLAARATEGGTDR